MSERGNEWETSDRKKLLYRYVYGKLFHRKLLSTQLLVEPFSSLSTISAQVIIKKSQIHQC